MSATFVKTLDILNALKAAIVALQLSSAYAGVDGYPTAFQSVQIYRNENLLKAFEDMFVYEDRACFIVPGGDDHENSLQGRVLVSTRSTDLVLLVADLNYAKENTALVGDATAPGVIALKDLILEHLTGSTLNLPGVCLQPTSGEPLRLTSKEQETAPARDCWALTFNTTAGSVRVAQPR